MSAIGSAMANHEVTPQRISQYINVMAQQMEGSLELIDAMNGLNLENIDLPSTYSTGTGDGNIYPSTNYTPPSGGGTTPPGYEEPAPGPGPGPSPYPDGGLDPNKPGYETP